MSVLSSTLIAIFWGIVANLIYDLLKTSLQDQRTPRASLLVIRLLKLTLPCDEAQDYIIGDLFEEFQQFSSKLLAYLWLSKQVIKSVLPLAYKTIKARLASRFGERSR